MKPGKISYILKIPPLRLCQVTTVIPPLIKPAIAPLRVVPRQNNARRIIGPNVAPNPAQA